MEFRLLRRPLCNLLSRKHQAIAPVNLISKRYEATARRTKKKLIVKPDASFIFSGKQEAQGRIIFNPPSSASDPIHTPLSFLPRDDPRRQLLAPASSPDAALPPPIRRPVEFQRNHLTEDNIADMKRLRKNDPENWTRSKLAKKFNCSSRFVRMCCELSEEKVELEKAKLEAVKARWGPRRRMAREDRVRRKDASYRDE